MPLANAMTFPNFHKISSKAYRKSRQHFTPYTLVINIPYDVYIFGQFLPIDRAYKYNLHTHLAAAIDVPFQN